MRTAARRGALIAALLLRASAGRLAAGAGWFFANTVPDVAVDRVEVRPAAPFAGTTVAFDVLVRNDGRGELRRAPLRMEYRVESEDGRTCWTEWCVRRIERLAPGDRQTFATDERALDVPAGAYRFVLTALRLGGEYKGAEKDLGDNTLAQTFVVRARERPMPPPPPRPATADTLRDLQALRERARALKEQSNPERSIEVYRRVVSLADTTLGRLEPFTLESLAEYADQVQFWNRYALAERLRLDQVARLEELHGVDDPALIQPLRKLAWLYCCGLQRSNEAVVLFQRALRLLQQGGQLRGWTAGQFYFEYVTAYKSAGRHEEALKILEQAIALQEREPRPDDHWVRCALEDIKECCAALGRPLAGLPLHDRAMRLKALGYGETPDTQAMALRNDAFTLGNAGKHAEAYPIMQRALACADRAPDLPLSHHVGILGSCASYAQALGKKDEARGYLERALKLSESAQGHDVWCRISALQCLARFYEEIDGRMADAEKLLRTAVEVEESAKGPAHYHVACQTRLLAEFLVRRRQNREARRLFERALAIFVESQGQTDSETRQVLSALAKVCRDLGDEAAAASYRRRYEETAEKGTAPAP